MQVEIWSDIICPWCYLGKARFDAAVQQLDWGEEISVRFRAFQLDPRAAREPKNVKAAVEAKYGPGAFHGMQRRLDPLGAEMGLTYHWDTMLRVSTFDAHRLMAWAFDTAGAATQLQLGERLFRAYFTDGDNVADPDRLAVFASEVGLDADEARDIVDEGRFTDEVLADWNEALEFGFGGVPAFLLERKAMIPGAQDVETIRLVLERTRQRLADAS